MENRSVNSIILSINILFVLLNLLLLLFNLLLSIEFSNILSLLKFYLNNDLLINFNLYNETGMGGDNYNYYYNNINKIRDKFYYNFNYNYISHSWIYHYCNIKSDPLF